MRTKLFKAQLCLFTFFIFNACSNSISEATFSPSATAEEDSGHAGFIRVHSEKSVAHLGTTDLTAKSNERPKMAVAFSYDYSIGAHEITCKEFNDVMSLTYGKKAPSISCSNSDFAASNTTFFDAILFANAKSKAESLDTAYTYTGIVYDNENHCTGLEGYAFHPDAEAYRLPTEAEWVLAANLDWNVKNSWNADNSNYKVHKVCSKGSNKFGLCDLAGNVMEWTNDWLGNFKDTLITNYVGAPNGGNIDERVVKGGSFRNPAKAINMFSRGDIYTVTSSTRADYVGFRLAIGTIPSPTWMENNGSATNSVINTLANSESIKKEIGTYKAKLAFRNDISGNLAFINYASGNLSVTEIADTISVYHPEISPDGNRVAFCTGIEGVPGKSELYIRELNASGKGLLKLDFESAAIPRWKVLDNGDTAIIFVSSGANNKDESTFLSSSTWQVTFKNNSFGKPKKLFEGNYHGGVSDDGMLAVTGARILRARLKDSTGNFANKIWYNEEQACNVSLSKGSSKSTLFLDFASSTGTEFVGQSYKAHERMFIADSTGILVNSIASPAGYTFDHTEWINETHAVATLTNANGSHEKIVLINTVDSSITELVKGEELWHPTLWSRSSNTQTESSLNLDSAGVYYYAGGSEASLCLRNKMELIWTYRNSELAILGSSRPLNGIKPLLMDNHLEAINLSNVPNSMFVSDFLFKNYLLNHLFNLKYLVVSLDIDMWWKVENDNADNFFFAEYRQYPGFAYDENHNFFEDGYPNGLLEATQESYNVEFFSDLYMGTRGFNPEPTGSWEEFPAVDHDSTWFDRQSNNYYANFRVLESMIETARNFNITVVGIIFPMSPNFKKTGSFGRYGFRRSQADKLVNEIADLSAKYSNFIFMDENKMGDHDYTDEMANNRDHLSEKGAEVLTQRLNALIQSLE